MVVERLVRDDATDQGKSVAMQSAGGKAENHVASYHAAPVEMSAALDRADRESCQVVRAVGVHAEHLSRLSADQGTICLAAAGSDARNHRLGDGMVKFSGGVIIEKKKRFGPLYDEVVNAHGDEVDADSLMASGGIGDQELGAHAIGGGEQHRIFVPACGKVE